MDVYYEQAQHDDITREDVMEETDVATLQRWHSSLRMVEMEIVTMLASVKGFDDEAAPRMARKLGYVRIATNWIKGRLEQLNGDVPDDEMGAKFKRMKNHLTSANQSLTAKNAKIKTLQARVAELEARLAALQPKEIAA